MVKLKPWQWGILLVPPGVLGLGLAVLAGIQLQAWGLSWVWGVIAVGVVGWRWLLSRWTRPGLESLESRLAEVRSQLSDDLPDTAQRVTPDQVEAVLRQTLEAAQGDAPLWEDLPTFSQRCQLLIQAIAHLYHPEVKYPLLNIHVPQAYGLMRGTVDDLDRWMQVTAPALNQVTVAQVYQAYETYRTLEAPLRRVFTALEWGQWLWNPIAAAAKQGSRPLEAQANQQLLSNFSQTLRETALTMLCRRAIALYGGQTALNLTAAAPTSAQAQTLRQLLEQATPTTAATAEPINLLLVGRTGAGKTSLINTLFTTAQAETDVLPNTDQVSGYRWETPTQEALVLWDSPGYEQVDRADFREQVLAQAAIADLILLVAPALDPALAADVAFLQDVARQGRTLPIFGVLTQVDRLRPLREWQPPYDWQRGDQPKERNIREAVAYRQENLGAWAQQILPVVTADPSENRVAWGSDALAVELVAAITPAKAQRLAQFLQSRDARIAAATQLIERYALQMTSGKGIVAFAKTPLFAFIATRFTGMPELGTLLAQSIPAEQVPVVASKLMLTYELATLLAEQNPLFRPSQMVTLWPLLLHDGLKTGPEGQRDRPPAQTAWAWGQALVEYWTQGLSAEALKSRFDYYLEHPNAPPDLS
ncbi:GTPase family protein [Leptolyngbya sp. PCC 6406]|uniref:GTPase family protein n=1 Tax=Leptolyngbya sp. PCC 6406 TaxID=1173264 RepID=UPI0002AC7F56|nr:GTPase [Leptolyngbya sp. PCC 6406]